MLNNPTKILLISWTLENFKTVPIGIEEAARIDGANKLQIFVDNVLPLVAPGIVATAIYVFINALLTCVGRLISRINRERSMPRRDDVEGRGIGPG